MIQPHEALGVEIGGKRYLLHEPGNLDSLIAARWEAAWICIFIPVVTSVTIGNQLLDIQAGSRVPTDLRLVVGFALVSVLLNGALTAAMIELGNRLRRLRPLKTLGSRPPEDHFEVTVRTISPSSAHRLRAVVDRTPEWLRIEGSDFIARIAREDVLSVKVEESKVTLGLEPGSKIDRLSLELKPIWSDYPQRDLRLMEHEIQCMKSFGGESYYPPLCSPRSVFGFVDNWEVLIGPPLGIMFSLFVVAKMFFPRVTAAQVLGESWPVVVMSLVIMLLHNRKSNWLANRLYHRLKGIGLLLDRS